MDDYIALVFAASFVVITKQHDQKITTKEFLKQIGSVKYKAI